MCPPLDAPDARRRKGGGPRAWAERVLLGSRQAPYRYYDWRVDRTGNEIEYVYWMCPPPDPPLPGRRPGLDARRLGGAADSKKDRDVDSI